MTKSEIDSLRHHRIFQYRRIIKIAGNVAFDDRVTPMNRADRAAIKRGSYSEPLPSGCPFEVTIERTMSSGHHFRGPISERGALAALAEYERKLDI